jgi:serine/threonine protein kinase
LERYSRLTKIAAGGMAEIFRAVQNGREGFERQVIIKRVRPALAGEPRFRDALLDEANLAMTFSHDNIVPVLDVGQAKDGPFLVLELVDGWDLATVLRRARAAGVTVPIGLALHVTAEVCRALAYIHGRQGANGEPLAIVHRDIDPRNVLISQQGEVKVTDFGVAKAPGRREQTLAGYIKGHPDFMSPEQAAGTPLGCSSDLFSVGSMLYLLTTGQAPFAADTDFETLLKVQSAQFTPPAQLDPAFPPAVAAIILRAMQREPSRRHESADQLMHELEALLRGEFPAGKSDLARWLAALAAKDGAPPTSRMPSIARPDEDEDDVLTMSIVTPGPVPALRPSGGGTYLLLPLALLLLSALGAAWAIPWRKRPASAVAPSPAATQGSKASAGRGSRASAASVERPASRRVKQAEPRKPETAASGERPTRQQAAPDQGHAARPGKARARKPKPGRPVSAAP